ncbi:MAG: cyclic nucleotide-binding domain-containing protein [Campylobacterales bacterium]|nr:cyclic nucleotide-binding domain-containing protein [Campylobacterales bacterium]
MIKNLQNYQHKSEFYKYVIIGSTLIATALVVCESTQLGKELHAYSLIIQTLVFSFLAIDFLLYLEEAYRKKMVKIYLRSSDGIIDFIASFPLILILFDGNALIDDIKTAFGITTFLKIARFSDALGIFKDVIINERKSILASMYLMLLLTLFISTLLYFVERDVNPDGFGNILEAMWWAIITLATVGYGDVIPMTALGKFLGSLASIVGLGMFALPTGILVNGFAQELARIRYITSWNLVAKVPIFANLDKGSISEISHLLFLKRFSRNEVIIKEGDNADGMYFILDGEVEVVRESDNLHIVLKAGDFFGEIALLRDGKRTATVIARKRAEMLELTTYDFNKLMRTKPQILEKIEEIAKDRHCQ